METLVSVAVGIGLSAACGFRIFVPLMMMNLAASSGMLHLSSSFEWIGSSYATVAFASATVLEVCAYYIPWLDHILDMIASPAAVIAGTVATASMVTEVSPFLKWTLAIIAGGGIAGIVQGTTVALRAKSSALTGGTANVLISSAELGGSILTTLLAIFVPIVCLVLIALLCIYTIRKAGRLFFGKTK
jgi:hypothetical protein